MMTLLFCECRSARAILLALFHITPRQHEVAERKRRYLPKRGENVLPKTAARGRAPHRALAARAERSVWPLLGEVAFIIEKISC